jgi:tetratricopeptide (TPR) repeat protein
VAASTRYAAGDRVGPYTVERHLKSGGMGAVYAARDADGEPVALKLLFERSAVALERFAREGRVAARLEHPRIVKVLDWGAADDRPYLAMELLKGVDLEARLRAERVATDQVIAMALQVCDALEHAHGARVVHRDLKPGNVFLCAGPTLRVKVLDFGIARVQDEVSVTQSGSVVGTVAYVSPEQALGERDLDARTDLWSLGVVLYECLAGRAPFVATTVPGILFQVATAPPPDLAALRPDLPKDLVRAVMRALRRARDERFPTARAMADALAAVGPVHDSGYTVTVTAQRHALAEASEASAEVRLASVACLLDVSDHALVADLAARFGGRAVPLRGDALLVVFGADVWFGDEPVRAARFACAAAVAARRISVATGRATRSAGGVAGEAIDAAVDAATEDGVVFDEATASAARAEVALEPRPDGSARPATRAATERAREDVETTFATPFFGREVELSLLLEAVDSAAARRQSVGVVVCGPEGIGKTRLRHEAIARLQERAAGRWVLARCEALQRDAPFAALGQALATVADLSLARAFTAPSRRADPQSAMDHALTVFQSVLQGLSGAKPVVLTIDDAQWLDAPSVSLLRALGEVSDGFPLVLWIFTRPEGRDVLGGLLPGITVRELPALGRPMAEKLLRAVAGTAPGVVLDRADGHPLFLEALGRLYAEHKARTTSEGAGEPAPDELPVSVQGALLGQIDRLRPDEREFIKRAAVFGNVAWVEGVTALGGDARVAQGLRRAGVLVPRMQPRLAGCAEVAFRGHLLREVAYGMWPPSQRARMHGLAAQWLEGHPEASPEELAVHWEFAGETGRAARARVAAAKVAARVGDVASTRAHTAKVIELTESTTLRWEALVARDDVLQLTPDRAQQREGLDAMESLARALTAQHRAEVARRRAYVTRIAADYTTAEAQGLEAIGLAVSEGLLQVGAAAHIEMALLRANQARHDDALGHAREACALAERFEDAWLQARARATLGYVLAEADALAEAREAYAAASEGFLRAGDLRRKAVIETNAGSLLVQLGRVAEAERELRAALEGAQRVGNRATVAVARHNLGVALRLRGEVRPARELQVKAAEEAAGLRHVRLASVVATERVYLALTEREGGDDLTELARTALVAAESSGTAPLMASARAVAARVAVRVGTVEDGALEDLRARARAVEGALLRLEILAAVSELSAPQSEDRAAFFTALEATVAGVAEEDRVSCRGALLRRFLMQDRASARGLNEQDPP